MPSITSVETFLVAPRWLFVKVTSDEGLTGWGEASCEGRSDTVAAAVAELSDLCIGADPRRIEDLWKLLSCGSFYRYGPILGSAVAGIDQALWDMAGKRHGVPVYELLGGAVRDKVRVYCWVGGDEPGEVAEQIAGRMNQGLTAVKMNASGRMTPLANSRELDAVVARVAAAREVLGPDGDVAVDFHGRVSYPTARRLAGLLEPLRPMFLEEPVLPENSHMLKGIVGSTDIPVATGERLYTRQEFLPVLEQGVSIVQPDLSHAGGITEVRKIAALAETFGALLAPHCPLGPIALAACLQVAACTTNHVIQEGSFGIHYNLDADVIDYLVDTSVYTFHDGYLPIPTGPGLGIQIDEPAVREAALKWRSWRQPMWRYADGAFAEW
mgnify:CR=1 FL=1